MPEVSPQTFMIAITGGSGSGKTTLAEVLKARLGEGRCVVVSEDHYYLPRALHTPDMTGKSNEEVERTINFDDPSSKDMALFHTHLEALKDGRAIDQPVYDFAVHERDPARLHRVAPHEVVIVEGVHVLTDPAFADLFDLTVYVDTPADLRLARRVRRDWMERGRSPERSLDQYLRFVRAAHFRFTEPAKYLCDLVIADEGGAAFRPEGPDDMCGDRLASPVWSRLGLLGVIGAS
ncbi:MAG: uridine kinase [Hyphomonadaceae bacterium]